MISTLDTIRRYAEAGSYEDYVALRKVEKNQNKVTVEGMNKKKRKYAIFPCLTTTVKMIGKFYSHAIYAMFIRN